MTLTVTDELLDAVGEFDTMLTRSDPAHVWSGVVDGGWLDIGVADGCRLADLVEFAYTWGRHATARPYTSTLLAHRWIDQADADMQTFCFGRAGQPGVVPYAGVPGVVCLGESTPDSVDTFAALLPLGRVSRTPTYTGELQHEAAVLFAAEALGGAAAALDRAVEYAGYRRAYGQEIGRFQAVKHILADAYVGLEQGRGGLVWATESHVVRACSAVARRSQQVVEAAIQVFGGIGFTWELGLHEHYRRALAVQKLLTFG
jgi:hypothetical protein